MKANEFVKKYGFDGAYELWQGSFHLLKNNLCILSGSVCRLSDNEPLFSLGELKHLVESHELVENWGGLDDAKFALQLVRYPKRLKQAIADVESCVEVNQ